MCHYQTLLIEIQEEESCMQFIVDIHKMERTVSVFDDAAVPLLTKTVA
jgi:hypothetical protein